MPHAIRKKKKPTKPPQKQVVMKQIHAGEKLSDIKVSSNSKDDTCKNDVDRVTEEAQNRKVLATNSELSNENNSNSINNESKEPYKSDSNNIHEHDNPTNEPYLENEPESLRLLHASVTHPYNPHFPNDYLAYRERKKTEQVRKDLQRSALQRLDQQEKLRKKIEEERKKLLESGDVDKIVESASSGAAGAGGAGRGRGRGRGGVSNLPAWLLKKQQEQREAEGKGLISETKHAEEQFDDAAS